MAVKILEQVKAVMERESLIPDGAGVVVGVSGGADSVALLHILHRLGYTIRVAHLNHGIRGAESDADEQFLKDLCAKLGIECVTSKTDVPALAEEKGISLEMAAREARHDFFRSLSLASCPLTPAPCSSTPVICLAHHADDQLETFFLRAARGSGSTGLGGMRVFQKLDAIQLLRPMLGIRREKIVQWLEEQRLDWREDASNADETIPRNLVRHQILPILGKINECAAGNILRTMEILRDEEDCPERAARRCKAKNWLIEHGVVPSFDAVERWLEFSCKKSGTKFLDLEGLRVINEYGVLKAVDAVSQRPRFSVRMEKGRGILRGEQQASVSLASVAGRAVVVRAPKPGDRMRPYGMKGSRKLQDIFTDLKIPKAQRADWPVVECDGEIIWIPGYRIADGWELSDEAEPALHLFASNA